MFSAIERPPPPPPQYVLLGSAPLFPPQLSNVEVITSYLFGGSDSKKALPVAAKFDEGFGGEAALLCTWLNAWGL
jgi:hypothetical protein